MYRVLFRVNMFTLIPLLKIQFMLKYTYSRKGLFSLNTYKKYINTYIYIPLIVVICTQYLLYRPV